MVLSDLIKPNLDKPEITNYKHQYGTGKCYVPKVPIYPAYSGQVNVQKQNRATMLYLDNKRPMCILCAFTYFLFVNSERDLSCEK